MLPIFFVLGITLAADVVTLGGLYYLLYLEDQQLLSSSREWKTRMSHSPMHNVAQKSHKEISKRSKINRERSPESNSFSSPRTILVRDLNQVKMNLNRISHIASDYGSYNCHSPLRAFTNDITCFKRTLADKSIMKCFNNYITRIRDTPMHALAQSIEFKHELRNAKNVREVKQLSQHFWKLYFSYHVLPSVPEANNIIQSTKFRNLLKDNILYAKIFVAKKRRDLKLFNDSPMRSNIGSVHGVRATIRHYWSVRRDRHFNMMISPMRVYTIRNRRHLNRRSLKVNNTMIREMMSYQEKRMSAVHDELLSDGLSKIAKRREMRDYCELNGIPRIDLNSDAVNQMYVCFNKAHSAHKFIADSNLDGFKAENIYYGKNNVVSRCHAVLSNNMSVNEIINAAQSVKNVSSINTDDVAKIHIGTDTKSVNINGSPQRSTIVSTIIFMRRDQKSFTKSQYNSCKDTVKRYIKRYDHLLTSDIGFKDKWLGTQLVVEISLNDNEEGINMKNVSADIITSINMVKDIIFATLSTEIYWINI